ncbi:hypothetical protein GCM10029964_024640 [Kibdelosporangium lantanae]
MSTTDVHHQTVTPTSRLGVALVVAAVVGLAVNTGIAQVIGALDPAGPGIGLAPLMYGPATLFGIVAGTVGWAIVRRRAARPRATLRVLVPVVVLLSFVPGAILMATGTSAVNMVGLWVMHLVVAVLTVVTASRFLPVAQSPAVRNPTVG